MAKGQFCYYCGIEVRSGKHGNKRTEHVPPKMLFRAFDCSSITVPSCPDHNTSRSNQDQAIIAGFMKALSAGKYQLTSDVSHAIQCESGSSTFETTKKSAQLTPFFRNPPENFGNLPDVTYITFSTDDWIRQVTAGLVYDATKKHDPSIDWEKAVIHSPNWFLGEQRGFEERAGLKLVADKMEMTESWEELKWLNGWSAHPKPYPSDIYRFYVYFAKPILFKHVFYSSFTWYVGFECNEGTRKSLGHKVLQANGL